MGHAVYTLSDPREVILKEYAKRLSEEKGMQREYGLYERVERLAGEAIAKKRHLFKPICANVDFYSGFVYSMLGIPEELYTPIFAISRISGWSAHRLEEVVNNGKDVYKRQLKELALNGIVNADPQIVNLMDRESGGGSSVLPVKFKKEMCIRDRSCRDWRNTLGTVTSSGFAS